VRFDKKKHCSIQYIYVLKYMFYVSKKEGCIMENHVALILAGGTAHFVTGWIFNCNMLLGQFWKKEIVKKPGLSKDVHVNLGVKFAASIALSIATCVAITVFEKYQAPVPHNAMSKLFSLFFNPEHAGKNFMYAFHTILFIWAGFIVPTSIGEVLWCGHNWKIWMIEMAGELLGLLAIAATVVFLV